MALLTIAAFLPALRNGFVAWDDDRNILSNTHFRGLGGTELHWMWSTFHLGHFIPLSWMSLGADYVMWGMNPAGYHATSVALHAANAALLYCIALRLYQAATRSDSGELHLILAAAFAALVFSVHPLRVESVAWVTERRDVLSGFFYLLAVVAWLRFVRGTSRAWAWYLSALVAAVCALLSKATAVTLPAVLAILSVYPLGRTAWRDAWFSDARRALYRELAPFAVVAAGAAVLALVALQPEPQLSLAGKLAVSAYSLAFYVAKTLLPTGLSPLYAMPASVDPLAARYILSVALVLVLCAVAWVVRRRAPGATAAWLTFVVILLPLLGVHQNGPQIAADRYTYNASAALALLAGAALLAVLRPRAEQNSAPARAQARDPARTSSPAAARFRPIAIGVAVIAIAALGALTWTQSLVWHDSASLWAQALRVEPDSPIAHNNWANVLMQRDEISAASEHYATALALQPNYAEAEDNMGVVFSRQGHFAEAVARHQRALALDPRRASAHNNWGVALARQAQDSAAIGHFRQALHLDPEYADAHVNWGNALVRLSEPDAAVEQYREAVALRPDNADAESNWGVALARQEHYAAAIEHFRRALVVNPDHAEARTYLERTTRLLGPPR